MFSVLVMPLLAFNNSLPNGVCSREPMADGQSPMFRKTEVGVLEKRGTGFGNQSSMF